MGIIIINVIAKMRLFIAIPLPDTFQNIIAKIQKSIDKFGKLKLVKPENVHLTLKFLGDVNENKIDKINKRLSFLKNINTFTISVRGLGTFPNVKRPRVIWMGTEKGFDEINELQKKIDSSLEDMGFKKENRFHPHYTIARVKFIAEKEKIEKFLKENTDLIFGEYTVDKIMLMESKLSPKGPRYYTIEEFHLKAETGDNR